MATNVRNVQPLPAPAGLVVNVSSRWGVWLLTITAVALTAARIWTLESPDPNRSGPFLSANDRSRWCTIRSLVEYRTYAIDAVIQGSGGERWDTIDKVYHAGSDGHMHFYSSKPPLWPTFLAGQYWLLRQGTGADLEEDNFLLARWLLILNNATALGIFVWLVGRISESLGANSMTTLYLAAAAAFGTSLTTFAVTLNNHLPAAVLVALSCWLLIQIWQQGGNVWAFALMGGSAAAAATLELPATGWLAMCLGISCLRSPWKWGVGALPAAATIAAAFFYSNYVAHGTWKPAYDFRGDGRVVATIDGDFADELNRGVLPKALVAAAQRERATLGSQIIEDAPVAPGDGIDVEQNQRQRWIVNRDRPDQWVITRDTESRSYQIRLWANWYDFEGSYWLSSNDNISKIDRGELDQRLYVLHMTVGHHGVLSLTPIFLLSLGGVVLLASSPRYGIRLIAVGSIALTLVVFAFYVTRPAIDRNYGGRTSGLRWVFWLYPLWLMWMVPLLDSIALRRTGRLVTSLLLGISVFSAALAWSNPWWHPWLSTWMHWGWE